MTLRSANHMIHQLVWYAHFILYSVAVNNSDATTTVTSKVSQYSLIMQSSY